MQYLSQHQKRTTGCGVLNLIPEPGVTVRNKNIYVTGGMDLLGKTVSPRRKRFPLTNWIRNYFLSYLFV